MTVSRWISRWIDLRAASLAPRTVESYQALLRCHIAPAIGRVGLSRLKPEQIARLLVSLEADGHSRTAQLCFVLLRAALRSAAEAKQISSNPCTAIARPRHRRADPRWWTPAELHCFLLAAESSPFILAWQLALCCGLRRGELAGLRWCDVDLSAGLLHIRNQRQRVKGRIIDAPPKSAAGRRDIPIPPGLLPLLDAQQLTQQAEALLTGCPPRYVVSPDGLPIAPERLNRELAMAIKAAGVRPINLHGLRHSMASLAVALGVPMRVLQTLLGHSSFNTTANIYSHVLRENQIMAMDEIARTVL